MLLYVLRERFAAYVGVLLDRTFRTLYKKEEEILIRGYPILIGTRDIDADCGSEVLLFSFLYNVK